MRDASIIPGSSDRQASIASRAYSVRRYGVVLLFRGELQGVIGAETPGRYCARRVNTRVHPRKVYTRPMGCLVRITERRRPWGWLRDRMRNDEDEDRQMGG